MTKDRELKIFKIKDNVDGKLAFIVAYDEQEAGWFMDGITSIPWSIVGIRPKKEFSDAPDTPSVWINHILPF